MHMLLTQMPTFARGAAALNSALQTLITVPHCMPGAQRAPGPYTIITPRTPMVM